MSGIPSWARVGAKVAWVGEHMLNMHPTFHPANGTVFTIEAVAEYFSSDGIALVTVAEMRNDGFGGPWWKIDRFRPVHTLETDIATHFVQFLTTPIRHGESAE